MIVLSHRGYWLQADEKNTAQAFRRSFALGFGTETDIRDRDGRLVISHDMADDDAMPLETFLTLLDRRDLPLALNIKADGLAAPLKAALAAAKVENAFVFDMAVPDMRAYLQTGIPVYTRMSEVERAPAWLDRAAGVWLDAFESTWYDAATIESLLAAGKQVCVVSSELHGRDHRALWDMLAPVAGSPALMLCTDLPEQAQQFFGVIHD